MIRTVAVVSIAVSLLLCLVPWAIGADANYTYHLKLSSPECGVKATLKANTKAVITDCTWDCTQTVTSNKGAALSITYKQFAYGNPDYTSNVNVAGSTDPNKLKKDVQCGCYYQYSLMHLECTLTESN
jgi:hypothetical protein